MVRPANVARSRACSQCKKKRIKCDLNSPSCQRCIESNLTCSGPLSGLFMVNASSTTFTPTPSKPRVPARIAKTRTRPAPPPAPDSGTESRPDLVLYHTPTPSLIYEEALLWTFLNYFTQRSATVAWDAKLPQLRSAKNSAAMKSAAKAVSLAFAAQNLNDASMAAAACEYYGESLRYHQRSFFGSEQKSICRKKAINALPVTVLLSYFEMIQPTSADAWLRHTTAAERLFVLLGPTALKDELLNHLYFIVKSNSVIRCFIARSRTQLYGQPWLGIHVTHPCGTSTDVYNGVVDLLARLANHYAVKPALTPPDSSQHDVSFMHHNLTELTRLWTAFERLVGLSPSNFPWIRPEKSHTDTSDTSTPLSQDDVLDPPPELQNPATSLTVSFFYAAAIQILTSLHSAEPDNWAYTDISASILHYSSQILSCVKHLTAYGIGCSCVRMMLPITTVHRLSPNMHQRRIAKAMFEEWSVGSGLAGLPSIAFSETNDAALLPFVAAVSEISQTTDWRVTNVPHLEIAVEKCERYLSHPESQIECYHPVEEVVH